ncbi:MULTISPECIES: DUF6325 family protein [unclassified Agromyces]|uniref:DUF6325 family protein n=1 Tax=unclassified Agromyces TaxID=2639701 RepID=UPI0007B1D3E7|nr:MULTISPECIES: DUF6325 family protein [unclassified Agromyces]KZE93653.1 hypothetical protein AVP42_01660 [Agromyces sp. NDB4Y10]MCK8608598.1 DUF1269 domain-containing protein [Agromyces sp. C10]
MAELDYGPVDIYVVSFEGDRPDDATLSALGELMLGDEIRLLDLLIVARGDDGTVTVREYEEFRDDFGFTIVELEASGVIGDEDIDELAEAIPPGTAGAVMAIELLWAKRLASAFAASGGEVLQVERIPATVVNEVFAAAANVE